MTVLACKHITLGTASRSCKALLSVTPQILRCINAPSRAAVCRRATSPAGPRAGGRFYSQPSPMPALTGHLVVQRANGGGSTAVEAPGHSGAST